MDFGFTSVVDIPQLKARAVFVTDTTTLFKEDGEISPIQLDDHTKYIPWGADNLMPYNVLKKIEADETLTTCQQWNAEVCYGQGLQYDTCECTEATKSQITDFFFEGGLFPRRLPRFQTLRLLRHLDHSVQGWHENHHHASQGSLQLSLHARYC